MTRSHHLKIDVNLIRLSNLPDKKLEGNLFIRYFISTPDNRQIQVDTKEIQKTTTNLFLREFASFECDTNSDQLKTLSNVKFELRMRRKTSGFGQIIARSILLGTVEISLNDVIASKGMSLEKWLKFSTKCGKLDNCKLPDLLVGLKMNQVMRSGIGCDVKRKRDMMLNEDWVGCEADMLHVESLVD